MSNSHQPTPNLDCPKHVVLIGNPNTGKSTLFGALVGVHQRVGNYPGVTVEKHTGKVRWSGETIDVTDLPGLYSLGVVSEDEGIASRALLGNLDSMSAPDVVVCVIDASNPRRNFYLISQILELGLPTIVALNMMDLAQSHGMKIDADALSKRLSVPVVPVQATKKRGVAHLKKAILDTLQGDVERPTPLAVLPPEVERVVDRLTERRSMKYEPDEARFRFLVRQGLMNPKVDVVSRPGYEDAGTPYEDVREEIRQAGYDIPEVETDSRYAWVDQILDGVVTQSAEKRVLMTDRLDRVLTHRVWGLVIFFGFMLAVFQAVFSWSAPLSGLIDAGIGWIDALARSGFARADWTDTALEGLVCEGLIGGIGGVLTFMPQIGMLFIFLAVLEDCGYMARAAFLMDRLMSRVGLCGKSFIPLLSCYGCAVPGIMAARIIENPRDRLTTILVAPFMTCSARLPVYALLISAFIPAHIAWSVGVFQFVSLRAGVFVSMYVIGLVAAISTAYLLKRSVLKGGLPCFVLELPSYKVPSIATVARRVGQRLWCFLRSAGTIICVASVVVWALLYFPHDRASVEADPNVQAITAQLAETPDDSERQADLRKTLEDAEAAAYQRNSLMGRFGRTIEPVFMPLGWDWRIGCSVMASFPAREIVVAALGVSFAADDPEASEEAGSRFQANLQSATWEGTDRPLFNIPVALSLMVFFTLCSQCAATLATMRRETNSWKWPVVSFAYMTGLAYFAAMATYQIGMFIQQSVAV